MSRKIKAPTVGGGNGTGTDKILIIGLNSMINRGNKSNITVDIEKGIIGQVNINHIVCCPSGSFDESKYTTQSEDLMTTGYAGSLMNTQIIGPATTTGNIAGTINEQLYAEFSGHLKSYKNNLSSGIDLNILNRWYGSNENKKGGVIYNGSQLVQAILFSGDEVMGFDPFVSNAREEYSSAPQFPLFRLNPRKCNNGLNFWLRTYVSPDSERKIACWATITNTEQFVDFNANVKCAVKPFFILA